MHCHFSVVFHEFTHSLLLWHYCLAITVGCGGGLLDMYNMELAPVRIAGLGGETTEEELPVIDVACGYRHTLAVTEDNRVYMWGQRQWMQPRLVTGDQGVNLKRTMTSVAAGKNFSAAVDSEFHVMFFAYCVVAALVPMFDTFAFVSAMQYTYHA